MCRSCLGPIFSNLESLAPSLGRGEFLSGAALATAALSTGIARASTGSSQGADTILYGGPILPNAGSRTHVEAIAISNGNVLIVGNKVDVMAHKTATTKLVNLDGRTALPGFIDVHQHPLTGGLIAEIFSDVGYTKYKTQSQVLAALKAQAAKTPAGGWVYASLYDNLLQGGDLNRQILDTVSTSHPVMVYYINMHTAAVNSAALKAAKVPDGVGVLPGGGHFGRDASGKLNGMVYEEPALKMMLVGIPKITPEMGANALLNWMKANAALGNTTVHEAGVLVFGNLLQGYQRVANVAPVRASISLMVDSMASAEPYRKYGVGAQATQIPGSPLTIYAMKIVGDGSNQTLTAFQSEPYLNSTSKGSPNYDGPAMKKLVSEVQAAGWPVSIHCNGDATLDLALDAIEDVYGANPKTGVNRIEHCTITRPEQLARMKKLGVQPSFLMNHVYYYGAAYRDQIFGPARTARTDSAGDCEKLGIPFTLHTDAPCSTMGTLQLVQTAVTRRCEIDGSIVGPDQAITLSEALTAVTQHAAGQIGMASKLGSLTPGKFADITVLESNPYDVPVDKIESIKIGETWVGGKKMFGA